MTIQEAMLRFPTVELQAEQAIRDLAVWPLPHTMEVMYTLARAYYELVREPGIIVVDGGEVTDRDIHG